MKYIIVLLALTACCDKECIDRKQKVESNLIPLVKISEHVFKIKDGNNVCYVTSARSISCIKD